MDILWCITGAGHQLQDSASFIRKSKMKHTITVAFSRAGYEVMHMYGLLNLAKEEFKEVVTEQEQGYSSPLVGRLAKGEYDLVIVSPCTANTVAKIVIGIADSLISNIVAQAVKSKTPVYVIPTDFEKRQETTIPTMIDPRTCKNCETCPPLESCPKKAIYRDGRVRLNPLKCHACRKCIEECSYGAISFGKKVRINIRDVDIENTKKLQDMEGITVFKNLDEIGI